MKVWMFTHEYSCKGQQSFQLTVGLQSPWFTAPASRLINGLDNEDIFGAALEAVHGVVVLLDVRNNHPAIQRITQTWEEGERGPEIRDDKYVNKVKNIYITADFSILQGKSK